MNRAPRRGARLRDLINGVYIFKGSLSLSGGEEWLVGLAGNVEEVMLWGTLSTRRRSVL